VVVVMEYLLVCMLYRPLACVIDLSYNMCMFWSFKPSLQLLEQAKKVIAVEYDDRMVREVLKRVEGTEQERKLQVIRVRHWS